MSRALPWRLVLIWIVVLNLPTAMAAWPLWQALAGSLDHAMNAAELTRHFDFVTFIELEDAWKTAGISPADGFGRALLVTLLLSPWLTGMVLAAAAAEPSRRPGFAALLRGGWTYYGRLARMLVWSVVPLGIAIGGVGLLRYAVGKQGEHAILESDVDLWRTVVWVVAAVVLIVVHASLEAGRAHFVTEPRRRSAVVAWWHGVRALGRRPVATLVPWLVITALGLLAAALLGLLRQHLPPIGAGSFVLGWGVTQLIAGVLAWMRCSRLFALVAASDRPTRA